MKRPATHRRALLLALAPALLLVVINREPTAANAASEPDSGASASATSSNTAAASSAAPAASAAATPQSPAQVVAVAVSPGEDVSAGKQLASQGAQGAAPCASCHGANGEGNAQSGFPRLAGLGRTYIEHQLNSYANGSRANPVMAPIASALNPSQRGAAAAYYASLGTTEHAANAAPAASSAATSSRSTAPPVLATRGDESKSVQGCVNCHGPQGIGDAGANPFLAGQHAQYLANALAAWKNGSRKNDPSGQMPAIAKALSDADAKALVAYFAGLPPPPPRQPEQAMASASASAGGRPAVQSGPVAATRPAEGSGTQQGAAVMGGSQGQGSGGAATNPQQSGTAKP